MLEAEIPFRQKRSLPYTEARGSLHHPLTIPQHRAMSLPSTRSSPLSGEVFTPEARPLLQPFRVTTLETALAR